MKIRPRFLAAVVAAATLPAVAATSAVAQEKYPTRAVTVIVPQAPGGANDTIARIITQKLAARMGQPFVVENRPGAGGNIGTTVVAKAKPDGYTLMLTTNSAQVINPALYKKPGFDAIKDFEPVGTVATAGYVLVANPAFPAKTVKELIDIAKPQPGKITYASAGNGTLNHLIGEMLQRAAGIELTHVAYKGAAAAVTDVVGGQVPLSVQSLPSSMAFIKAGKLNVLGVVNEKRVSALPDVPTIGETIKGFGSTPWYGLLAPAGTPQAVIQQLQTELAKVVESDEVRAQLAEQGCEPLKAGATEFAAMIADDLPRWARIVKESGATID